MLAGGSISAKKNVIFVLQQKAVRAINNLTSHELTPEHFYRNRILTLREVLNYKLSVFFFFFRCVEETVPFMNCHIQKSLSI